MSRVDVVQSRCDRCKRVELLPPQPKKAQADFEMRLLTIVVKYEDLCSSCKGALENIIKDVREWLKPVQHQFGLPTAAPPLTPAPNYVPPKPHSIAASKK